LLPPIRNFAVRDDRKILDFAFRAIFMLNLPKDLVVDGRIGIEHRMCIFRCLLHHSKVLKVIAAFSKTTPVECETRRHLLVDGNT